MQNSRTSRNVTPTDAETDASPDQVLDSVIMPPKRKQSTDTSESAHNAPGDASSSEGVGRAVMKRKTHGSEPKSSILSTSLLQELMQQVTNHDPSDPDQSELNYTSFEFDTKEHLMLSVLYIQQDCPDVMGSKSAFLDAMSLAFDNAKKNRTFDRV